MKGRIEVHTTNKKFRDGYDRIYGKGVKNETAAGAYEGRNRDIDYDGTGQGEHEVRADEVDMGGYSDYVMKMPASGEGVSGICHARMGLGVAGSKNMNFTSVSMVFGTLSRLPVGYWLMCKLCRMYYLKKGW